MRWTPTIVFTEREKVKLVVKARLKENSPWKRRKTEEKGGCNRFKKSNICENNDKNTQILITKCECTKKTEKKSTLT